VLIGEDGQDVRDLLSFLLRHSGLALEFAFDGAQALELAQQNHYDLLILDIQMPQLCGVEVVRSLRENGHTGPIIALTANAYQQEVDVYFQSGFDHVLAKPFQAQQLFKLIGLYCPAEPMENREFSSIENELTMEEVIAGFVSSLPQRLDRIRQCRSCNGMAGLRNEVHNLCVAGLFGFSKIEAAARTLQSKIDSGDENIGDLAGQLEFLLEQAYNDQAGPR
jgi:CheY-like chemotaxis protein